MDPRQAHRAQLGSARRGQDNLAGALVIKAMEHGFGVVFYRLDELLQMLSRDTELAPSQLRRKKYVNTTLVNLDEVGFEPMSR